VVVLRIFSLIDVCEHPPLEYDNFWAHAAQHVHRAGRSPERQITYRAINTPYDAATAPGVDALHPLRRRHVMSVYGTALSQASTAAAGGPPDVLLWRGHGGLVDHHFGGELDTTEAEKTYKPPDPWNPRRYYVRNRIGVRDVADGERSAWVAGEDLVAETFPVMPRTLWYSQFCFGAWEVSFARQVIARGCPYYIGSRRAWHGSECYDFLKDLLREWQPSSFAVGEPLEDAFKTVAKRRRNTYPVMFRATRGLSINSVTMIHAYPAGAYKFGKGHLFSSVGAFVSLEVI
jgi:hypothetical protein